MSVTWIIILYTHTSVIWPVVAFKHLAVFCCAFISLFDIYYNNLSLYETMFPFSLLRMQPPYLKFNHLNATLFVITLRNKDLLTAWNLTLLWASHFRYSKMWKIGNPNNWKNIIIIGDNCIYSLKQCKIENCQNYISLLHYVAII